MIQTNISAMVSVTSALATLREHLDDRHLVSISSQPVVDHTVIGSGHFLEADRKNVDLVIGHLRILMESHNLYASLDRLNRLTEVMDREDSVVIRDIVPHLQIVKEVLEDELKRRLFMYLPPQDSTLHQQPLAQFPKSSTAFPSSISNMIAACQCQALGQHTASVFHSMGILQSGLYALANDLGVSFNFPLVLAEWHSILVQVESKIDALRQLPKSQQKDDQVTFYSECAVQFRYFKDAWRNHIAHMREEYDRDMAHSVLIHTKDFMERLSEKVREIPIPAMQP